MFHVRVDPPPRTAACSPQRGLGASTRPTDGHRASAQTEAGAAHESLRRIELLSNLELIAIELEDVQANRRRQVPFVAIGVDCGEQGRQRHVSAARNLLRSEE